MSARAAGQTRRAALVASLVAGVAAVAPACAQLPGTPGASTPAASKAPDEKKPVQPTRAEDKDVIEASLRWLKLIDAGHYGDAWDGGAAPLKKAVTRKGFVDGMNEAREPYGAVKSRAPGRFARAHDVPGGPEGDYALVFFQTRFTNGKTAEEQVIWLLESEDHWRVSGYFIR